jgi:hypothetical protein
VDFPRHWKIFLQYVKTIHDSAIYDSVLIVDKKFDANEKEKSQALGVWKLLSESKLHKYVESASAETVNFSDIITNGAAEETEYDLTPPELEESADAVIDEPRSETEENSEAITGEPLTEPEIEKNTESVIDKQPPEIKESADEIINEPIPEINDPPAKTRSPAQIIFEPVDGENTLEQVLREQDMVLMKMQAGESHTELSAAVKSKEYNTRESGGGFTLSDADAALLKSLEPEKVNPQEVQFLFRHPKTGVLVTGIVETVTGNMVVFKPDNLLVITTFSMGQYIDAASYKNGDSVSLVGAYAVPYDDTIHLTLERHEFA